VHNKIIIITILSLICLTTANICAQSRTFRAGEFLIDTNLIYASAASNQISPDVASDDTTAFVVWFDKGNGPSTSIYGARVDQDGNILDPTGIFIARAGTQDAPPAIAYDGTNYLVVWHQMEGFAQYDIYGIRIDKEGNLLDSEPFVINDTTGNKNQPKVAFDGTNFLVVWYDNRNGVSNDIYGTLVAQNGTVLNPSGIAISKDTANKYAPDVSFDGNNYMVVWQDQRDGVYDIYGSRVAQDGNVLDPAGIQISGATDEQSRPSIDFDGTNYLVAWYDTRSVSSYDIYGTLMDTSGTVLNPAGIEISTATDQQYMPSVSFDGINYLVTWHDQRNGSYYDIFASRMDTSGVVLDPSGICISNAANHQQSVNVASYNNQWLTVWTDNRNSDYDTDVYGSRVEGSGTVLDTEGILISATAQKQERSAIASDGTNYLVVWQEARGESSYDIYGMRVDLSGNALDSNSIPISTNAERQENPAVTFDGTNYLVVWEDNRNDTLDIYGSRVEQNGNVLDTAGIPISTAFSHQRNPAIAFDGINYLVVWEDFRDGASVVDIYGARVEQNGNVLDPSGIAITDDDDSQSNPSVAFDGTNYFVVWHDYDQSNYEQDICGARIDTSGSVLDINGFPITTAENDQWYPVVDFDGTNYLVAWFDSRNSDEFDIFGTRVNPDGTILNASGIPILELTGTQQIPFIVFDGINYLVGCENYQGDSVRNILGAAVDTSGSIIETYTVSDFNTKTYQPNPAAAKGPGTQLLVTFSDWTDNINGNPANVQRIWGKIYPKAGIEENNETSFNQSKFNLQISPNPILGICNITFTQSVQAPVQFKLFDAAGRLLHKSIVGSKAGYYDLEFDMSDLPDGIYFLRVESQKIWEIKKAVLLK